MVDYELVDETNGVRYNHSWWRIGALILVYILTTTLVFLSWNSAYSETIHYPPLLENVPDWWYRRAHIYANSAHDPAKISHDFRILQKNHLIKNFTNVNSVETAFNNSSQEVVNDKHQQEHLQQKKLVCYYSTQSARKQLNDLHLADIPAHLCTHINIGFADVRNNSIILSDDLITTLKEVPILRAKNPDIKLLLCVGGGDTSYGFPEVVRDHANRKTFIQSLKIILRTYLLDGVDLDWEFPSAYNKERQHFSQLLYEIKQEYRREKREYLLTVAVAAPEGIALFAYDVREINLYADFANIMTYDYHFWSRGTPFTGLNAPLYPRINEGSILATLNINYSVNWWLANGLERSKLVVGLPTYGHSFTLVNPFNNAVNAPAESIGSCGSMGFTTYSEVCWFESHNFFVSTVYDQQTCSPYLYCANEWISFENEMSIECKSRYAKSNDLGGVMIFSLNTDDFRGMCAQKNVRAMDNKKSNLTFPLIETVRRVLFNECSNL